MTYFKKNNRRNSTQSNSQYQEQSYEANRCNVEQKKRGQSKNSYLKAFKKYYIEKLLEEKCENKQTQNKQEKENFKLNDTKAKYEHYQRQNKQIEKGKNSTTTDSGKNSRAMPTFGKISQSKIVNLVKNNDYELQTILYGSITDMERQVMKIGDLNDLSKQNYMLRNSITSLKQVLKEKLEVALKKNKQQLTAMFDEYSTMIKKLLQDKENLANSLESWRIKCAEEERKVQQIEKLYNDQIRIIISENTTQTANTKQQIQQFLQVIEQYQQEAQKEKNQLQNLRDKLVELEMQNDSLKVQKEQNACTKKMTTQYINSRCEQQLQKYAQKIETLLEMVEDLQSQNKELKKFLKSCKCSRIQSHHSSQTQDSQSNVKQIVNKYEKQLIDNERDYIKGQKMLMVALAKKDECIERLNLVIHELRAQRYESVDRITTDVFQKNLSSQSSN